MMIPILAFIIIAVMLIIWQTGIPGSPNYLGWKLSGVWSNESDTLQIMMHCKDSLLSGYVVSAQVEDFSKRIVIGSMVISDLKLQSAWNWSTGKYIDPFTKEEHQVKVKMKGDDILKVRYVDLKNGVVEMIKEEEWKLINPL